MSMCLQWAGTVKVPEYTEVTKIGVHDCHFVSFASFPTDWVAIIFPGLFLFLRDHVSIFDTLKSIYMFKIIFVWK